LFQAFVSNVNALTCVHILLCSGLMLNNNEVAKAIAKTPQSLKFG